MCTGGCLYNSQFNIYSQKAHVSDPANTHVAKVLVLCHHLEKRILKHSINVDKSSEKILEGFICEPKLTYTLCKCLLKSCVHCLRLKRHGSGLNTVCADIFVGQESDLPATFVILQ